LGNKSRYFVCFDTTFRYCTFEDEAWLIMRRYNKDLAIFLEEKAKVQEHKAKKEWFLPKELKKICCKILKGLAFLHSHNIAHRDLKVSKRIKKFYQLILLSQAI
jgi:serine/threonine protein kinase